MSVVKINAITVPKERAEELVGRFAARAGEVSKSPGFEAFELLRLALNEARFEDEAVERIRAQIISRLQRATTNPNDIASRVWWTTAYPGHPYGRQVSGTLESVPRISL